jgi:hypothetical protein
MANLVLMVVDEEGHAYSTCQHWEGFTSILWSVLSAARYPNPPLYVGQEIMETGVRRCRVRMTILQHPLNPAWLAIETEVVGHHLIDLWEVAAIKALTTFCEQHPLEVILAPAGLFSAVSESDPLWLDRLAYLGHLADQIPVETIVFLVRCMNALYCLQALQSQGWHR